MKHVIIVGGGFAGLNAAKRLGDKPGVRVTLIDRRNHHLFQPLLYQVATAGLSPADIATPIRAALQRYRNVDVLMGTVTQVDPANYRITTDFGEFTYDYLVLACGASHGYFGHDDWEPFAPGLKTLAQATEIRRRILTAFEIAERLESPAEQRRYLTFVIVGAGPTGVELAGSLVEISRITMGRDFRKIDPKRTRVILVEGGARILPGFDKELAERASVELERKGVSIWTNSMVTKIDAAGVRIGDSEQIDAHTVLWAAGVQSSALNKQLGVDLDRQGRVIVAGDLSIEGHAHTFVLGDQANCDADGQTLPGIAPVALQQGKYVAKLILREINGKPRTPFSYFDKGMMATIGRSYAIVQTKSVKFGGFLAWVAWIFIHVWYLIGFRNRLVVLIQWAWSYLTFSRGARLITQRDFRDRDTVSHLPRHLNDEVD